MQYSFVGYGTGEMNISTQRNWTETIKGFTITGETIDASPPPKDSDGDGITDPEDKCPTVPGPAKYQGCPVPDDDKDGIPDEEDKCPTIPGLAKYQGCPVADTSLMKIFPIPYPKASAVYTFPWSEVVINGVKNFSSVDAKITGALTKAGYTTRSYYYIPHGFALVTRIEKINDNGTCKAIPERWEINVDPPKNILDYIGALFNAPKGYFRVIVFLVTDVDLTSKNQTVDKQVASDWVDNGYTKLPAVYNNLAFTKDHFVTAVIYEYKKIQGHPATITNNRLPAKTHLAKSFLVNYLK